jgi:hypothetical protein
MRAMLPYASFHAVCHQGCYFSAKAVTFSSNGEFNYDTGIIFSIFTTFFKGLGLKRGPLLGLLSFLYTCK